MTVDEPGEGGRDHWERVFREKREDEVSWFQEQPRTSLELIQRTGVGRDARIVDVGGGASRLVDALLDAGYRELVVVDIAAAALDKARARLGARADGVRWIVSDVRDWTAEETVEVWHDRAAFHFLRRAEDRSAYLASLRRALRPGGHAIIATFASDGPERCSGLPVQRYEPEGLAAVVGPQLRLVESLREAHATPWGKTQSFQYSRFERVA